MFFVGVCVFWFVGVCVCFHACVYHVVCFCTFSDIHILYMYMFIYTYMYMKSWCTYVWIMYVSPWLWLPVSTCMYKHVFTHKCRYIDGIKPGQYGVPKPFYFPCLPSYWTGKPFKSRIRVVSYLVHAHVYVHVCLHIREMPPLSHSLTFYALRQWYVCVCTYIHVYIYIHIHGVYMCTYVCKYIHVQYSLHIVIHVHVP